MDLGLQGRTALVTGASKGIGRAIAAALAAEGACVAVSSSSKERIEQTAAEIGATPLVFDSDRPQDAERLVADVTAQLGPVDILVCNTGGPPAGPDPLAFPDADWEAAHRSLVLTPLALIRAVLPSMRERRWGRILQVASTSVREPLPNIAISNVERSGAVALFATLARKHAADGITFNTLLPGQILTDRLVALYGGEEEARRGAAELIPAGRPGKPEEMGAAAAFLCSEQAAYITGVALPVDGGLLHGV
jgi:3-oxoacyl-[acyl-carrier protein] reductase